MGIVLVCSSSRLVYLYTHIFTKEFGKTRRIIIIYASMKEKWYHFVLLVTLANANPIGNPAEEQFLKKYFNSGFEFHSDEEKSFRTVSNYAKIRGLRRPARKLSLFDARGHPRDEITSGFSKPQNSLRNEVRPVFNLKDGYFHTSGGQKSKIEDNHAKVEEAFREEAEKHYSIIDNMIEDEKVYKNSAKEKKQVVKVYEVKIINGVPQFIPRDP